VRRLAIPFDTGSGALRLAGIGQQRSAVESAHAHQHTALANRHLYELGANDDSGWRVVNLEKHGIRRIRLARGQRAFERAAEVKCAGRAPDDLGGAAIELEIDAIPVRRECQHGGQRCQPLGH
jgi:hypothetical protein